MTVLLYKEEIWRKIYMQGDHHMKMQAEIEVMLCKAKDVKDGQ